MLCSAAASRLRVAYQNGVAASVAYRTELQATRLAVKDLSLPGVPHAGVLLPGEPGPDEPTDEPIDEPTEGEDRRRRRNPF